MVKHDKFSSRGLLIFGNGPSLGAQIDRFQMSMAGYDVLCVNYFGLTNYFNIVQPRYYMIADPYFFYDGYDDEKRDKLLSKIICADWGLVLIVPYTFRRSQVVSRLKEAGFLVEFINTTPVDGSELVANALCRRELGMPFPQTVINAAIFAGLILPYKNIFVLGVEQSWLKDLIVNNDNTINVELKHFYQDDKNGLEGHATLATLSTFLFTQYRCFRSHERLAAYARRERKNVINLTPGSYIDAYPRADISSIMSEFVDASS